MYIVKPQLLIMNVQSKFLAPGKIGFSNLSPSARYKGTNRGPLGSTSSYLSLNFKTRNLQFKLCNSNKCKTCPQANPTLISNHSTHLLTFCKVYNCIYKLTCNHCQMAYIGQTSNSLHKRINLHRSNVTKFSPSNIAHHNNFEFEHFHLHGFSNITIDILDIKKNVKERLFTENKYITMLNTCYPYGLNQLIQNKTTPFSAQIYNNNYSPIYNNLNLTLYNKTTRKQKGRAKNKSLKITPAKIKKDILDLQQLFDNDFKWKNIRTFIFSIKKKFLIKYFQTFRSLDLSSHFSHTFYDILSARSKHFQINLFDQKDKKVYNSSSQLIITFSNHIFNKLNLNHILKSKNNPFPIKSVNLSTTYKYPITLGRRIFNYNKFTKTCTSSDSYPCPCTDPNLSKYVNQDHGHIITGDLSIVKDTFLRKLMRYGTKFRVPSKLHPNHIITQFIDDLELFLYNTAIKFNKPLAYFNMWKINTIENLKKAVSNIHHNSFKSNQKIMQQQIKNLQNKFIITYVDKCSNNYAIICKSYYHSLLNSTITSNDLFKTINNTLIINNRKIIKFHKLLNLKCPNLNYPYIVLVPKFHKSPIKFRTVTVGCNTFNNTASKLLLNILNIISKNLTETNVNSIRIKNSYELLTKLQKLSNVKRIKTFDFKDLFNNITISDLHAVINRLINDNISLVQKSYNLDAQYINTLTNFVLKHNYIFFNNTLFQQIKGLPQGNQSSSLLADLYLNFYEQSLVTNNFIMYRYIDDILILNLTNNPITVPVSYPSELELIENIPKHPKQIDFLDIQINISNNKLLFNIYNKRKDFKFHVNTFTNYHSCLHKTIFKNIILNQLNRIKKICSKEYKHHNIKCLYQSAIDYQYPPAFVKKLIYQKACNTK